MTLSVKNTPSILSTDTIKILKISDLKQVLALQDRVIAALPDSEKNFILPVSEQTFEQYLHSTMHHVIGMFNSGDKLIAQSVLHYPDDLAIETDLSCFNYPDNLNQCVVIGSVCVDPYYRGANRMQNLIKFCKEYSDDAQRPTRLATVERHNAPSAGTFLKAAFNITDAGIDPTDKAELLLVTDSNLTRNFRNAAHSKTLIIASQMPVNHMKNILDLGYMGLALERCPVTHKPTTNVVAHML